MLTCLSDERGSISPISVALFTVAMLLLMVFLDREWVNYSMHLAQQSADFAAEAAAVTTADPWSTVSVRMKQIRYSQSCSVAEDAQGNCPGGKYTVNSSTHYQSVPITASDTDLVRNWRHLAGCGSDPEEPSWACETVTVQRREIRYSARSTIVAETAFTSNWQDRSSAKVYSVSAMTRSGNRQNDPAAGKVYVSLELELRSLFGLGWHLPRVQIVGTAITQLRPLILT